MSKFWFEDFSQLFSLKSGMFPSSSQSLVSNLNSITRLAIIACLLVALAKPELSSIALLIILIIILTIYYGIVSKQEADSFREMNDEDVVDFAGNLFLPDFRFNPVTKQRFCNDDTPLKFDEEFFSSNQALVGGPNPKTTIPPIIAPPTHELSEWRASDLTVHSAINDERNFDVGSSGVDSSFFIDYSGYLFGNSQRPAVECSNCQMDPCVCSSTYPSRVDQILTQTIQPGVYEKSDFSEPINSLIGISYQKPFDPTRITQTSTPCGSSVTYSAHQEKNDYLSEPTDTNNCLLPGSSHGGLRFGSNQIGGYQTSSPQMPKQQPETNFSYGYPRLQTESDTYDPRFTGYGPTDRGYLDPVNGQPRYFYDDVNSITMPNFIARTKTDIYPWSPQYGSGVNGSLTTDGIGFGDGYKQLAENAFMDASLKFRTELQERLMRKRNAEMWQKRVAPIRVM